MILNIFEEETEELNLAEVANDFSCQCDKRKEDFGYREFVSNLFTLNSFFSQENHQSQSSKTVTIFFMCNLLTYVIHSLLFLGIKM